MCVLELCPPPSAVVCVSLDLLAPPSISLPHQSCQVSIDQFAWTVADQYASLMTPTSPGTREWSWYGPRDPAGWGCAGVSRSSWCGGVRLQALRRTSRFRTTAHSGGDEPRRRRRPTVHQSKVHACSGSPLVATRYTGEGGGLQRGATSVLPRIALIAPLIACSSSDRRPYSWSLVITYKYLYSGNGTWRPSG